MDQRIIDLYHEYLSTHLRRRIFLKRLSELAGSDEAALELVPVIEAKYGRKPAAEGARPC